MVQNKYQLILNIKSKGYTGTIPSVTANDNIVFDIQVYDGAVPFDLTGVSRYTLVSMRKDNTSVIREGTLVNGLIEFVLGSSETSESGRVDATVQLYDADNKRVSSAPLIYNVISDPSLNGSLPADDNTLVIANESLLTDAINKANNADTRIDNIVAQAGNDNTEIVDARQKADGTTYTTLRDRLNASDVSLNGKANQTDLDAANQEIALKANQSDVGNLSALQTTDKSSLVNAVNEHTTQLAEKSMKNRNTDLSYMLRKNGIKTVITGDSLSYNRYDFDGVARSNAYDCFSGMLSWSFMLRDAIYRNDPWFMEAPQIKYRNLDSATIIELADYAKYFAPFNGRNMNVIVSNPTEEFTFNFKHQNVYTDAIYLYFMSDPSAQACTFDIYVDGTLKTTVNTDGTGKNYQGYETIVVEVTGVTNGVEHEIKFTNIIKKGGATGQRYINLMGVGSTYCPVYLTGSGGKTSQWLIDNIQTKILQYSPDFVVIIIGINDVYAKVSVDTYKNNMINIVNQIRTAKADTQILLIAPPSTRDPANPASTVDPYMPDSIVEPYCKVLEQVAADNSCYFISLFEIFKYLPVSDWRVDNVHMKKYGNTILARTILELIMPKGNYDKSLVDANLAFYGKPTFPDIKSFGKARINYNSTSGNFEIYNDVTYRHDILSVNKQNANTLRVTMKYNTTFYNVPTLRQFGASVSQLINTSVAAVGKNYIDYYLWKASGTLVADADLTAKPNDFNFMMVY